jgi:putative nucleotidyltransferase with HDIG domain
VQHKVITMPDRGADKERRLVERIANLPLLPSVVARILALDPEDPGYFDRLVKLAEEDPNFAVRLLRVANAAASAPLKPIATVRQAAIRVGARESAGLVTSMSVSRVFVPRNVGQKNLWIHSLQVAVAARTIAGLAPDGHVAPDQAYLAGLLHDIGRFVMFEGASDDLDLVETVAWDTPQSLLQAERSLLGYDHAHVGALVCRRWSLPEDLGDVAQHHHAYGGEADGGSTRARSELRRIVQMADLLSIRLMRSPEFADLEPADLTAERAAHCACREWQSPPVPPSRLAPRVAAIRAESALLVRELFG